MVVPVSVGLTRHHFYGEIHEIESSQNAHHSLDLGQKAVQKKMEITAQKRYDGHPGGYTENET